MESYSFNKQFVTLIATENPPAWLLDKIKNNSATLLLATTAQAVESALFERQFGLIIIDDALNAKEIISKTKTTNSINAHTPYLALISEDTYARRKKWVAAGFDDCLIKPLFINELIGATTFWQNYDRPHSYLDSIQKLLSNCRNNRKLAVTLYNKLFTTLPEQLDLIETAMKHGDYVLALDITHKLNGCVKTCFLMPIAPITHTLESTLIENNHELVEDCFLLLKQKIKAFIEQREEILSYLESPTAGQ